MNNKIKNIFIIIVIFGISDFTFCGEVPYSFDPALCTTADGKTQSLVGKVLDPAPSQAMLKTGIYWKGGKFYQKNPGDLFSSIDYMGLPFYSDIIQTCSKLQGEVDEGAMALNYPGNFGLGEFKEKNLLYIQSLTDRLYMHRLIPLYNLDDTGVPVRVFQKDLGVYPVLQLDSTGTITDDSIETVSTLSTNGKSLAIAHMMNKAKKFSLTKVTVGMIQAQLEGIQKLSMLYKNNITNTKAWLSGLKQYTYDGIDQDMKTLSTYLSKARVGNDADKNHLKIMIELCNKIATTLNSIRVIKDRVRPIIDDMMNTSKNIPGSEPSSISEMVKKPKKYTLPFRLIFDALSDLNLVKLFFEVDIWSTEVIKFQEKLKELKSVTSNFIPNLDKKITDLTKKITNIPQKKSKFEKILNSSSQKGTGTDFDGTVRNSFDELQAYIMDIVQSYEKIITLIESAQSIKDDTFQSNIKQAQGHLTSFPETK